MHQKLIPIISGLERKDRNIEKDFLGFSRVPALKRLKLFAAPICILSMVGCRPKDFRSSPYCVTVCKYVMSNFSEDPKTPYIKRQPPQLRPCVQLQILML